MMERDTERYREMGMIIYREREREGGGGEGGKEGGREEETDRLTDREIQTDRQTDRHTDTQKDKQESRKTERQRKRDRGRQRQKQRQTDAHTDRQRTRTAYTQQSPLDMEGAISVYIPSHNTNDAMAGIPHACVNVPLHSAELYTHSGQPNLYKQK